MTPTRITLNDEDDFEKEYQEFQKEGLELQSPMCKPHKGDEFWFQFEARLPRAGLDPKKDTTYISNKDLFRMFREKVPNRGYWYRSIAIIKVTSSVKELYMPLYQVDSLLEQYIPESFACTLISKVSHSMPMNWTRYVEGVQGRKKGDVTQQHRHMAALTIKYKSTRMQATYEIRILDQLEMEWRKDFFDCWNASMELQEV